eukprot:752264-Hanusia_phi.AAC.2
MLQLCYTSAFTLLFYYIATRHRPVLVEALKGDTSTVQGETGVPEASARGDGDEKKENQDGDDDGDRGGDGWETMTMMAMVVFASPSSSSAEPALTYILVLLPSPLLVVVAIDHQDEDGLPLVVGSCLTYLSLLLQSPTGEASSHVR